MASTLGRLISRLLGREPDKKPAVQPPRARVRPPPRPEPGPPDTAPDAPPPRAGGPLRGHIETQGRTNVLVPEPDPTEELLTLSDDDERPDSEGGGIDPYNTGAFTKKDVWGKGGRR